MKSYDVKFWAIRPGKAKTRRTYEVRWKVGHTPHSSTLGNKAQADNFLSDLRQAARNGEAFALHRTDTGAAPAHWRRPAVCEDRRVGSLSAQ